MNPTLTVHAGNCLESLRKMADNSVHCCVTSPPYWQLRNYSLAPTDWPEITFVPMLGLPPITVPAEKCVLGMERDPLAFVAHTVLVFEEVRRVLRPDGTLWLNFGDNHSNAGGAAPQSGLCALSDRTSPRKNPRVRHKYTETTAGPQKRIPTGFKKKDLIGMPWRIAFALQAQGWYLRMDNIWNKPNPLPESVTDRTTKCHEYLFLFSKRPSYFYDAEAIKEKSSPNSHARSAKASEFPSEALRQGEARRRSGVNPKAGMVLNQNLVNGHRPRQNPSFSAAITAMLPTRNKRSVWTITTKAFKGAHFATFPLDLVRPCVRAGTSAHGVCAQCGAPFVRILERGKANLAHQRQCGGDAKGEYAGKSQKDYNAAKAQDASATKARILAGMVEKKTIGWEATCKCEAPSVIPATVLDPFAGSFTTAFVSMQEGRNAIALEMNPEYIAMGEKRCTDVKPFEERKRKIHKQPAEQLTLLQ